VGDGIEERALALVQAHLAHEPRRERDQTRQDEREEQRTEDQHQPVARRKTARERAWIVEHEDLPANREQEHKDREPDPERERNPDGATHDPGLRT